MKVASFIPIKLNNQRLPGKNTLPLGRKITCEYIFDTINQIDLIDEKFIAWVSIMQFEEHCEDMSMDFDKAFKKFMFI